VIGGGRILRPLPLPPIRELDCGMVQAWEGFWKPIREEPEADAPRHIFADWLDDSGDIGRAEFIRAQLALAKLPRYDRRRAGLANIERRLLSRYAEEWAKHYSGLATGPVFQRGFIEEAKVTARQFLARAPALFEAGPLRHLHILDVGSQLRAVLHSPHLAKLSGLTIYAQHLGPPLARAIGDSPYLEGLRRLTLARNELGDEGVEHLVLSPSLKSLEELDLGENEIGQVGARLLARCPRFGKLSKLQLAGNAIGPLGAETIAASDQLSKLTQIGLKATRLGGPRSSLLEVSKLLRFPILDFAENGLTADSLRPILETIHPPAVRELDLGHNDLGDAGAERLANASSLAGLRVLRLTNNGIGDDGLRALAASPMFRRLTHLEVGNNPVGDSGVQAILDSATLKNLRHLICPAIGLSFRMRLALHNRYGQDHDVA